MTLSEAVFFFFFFFFAWTLLLISVNYLLFSEEVSTIELLFGLGSTWLDRCFDWSNLCSHLLYEGLMIYLLEKLDRIGWFQAARIYCVTSVPL